MSEAPSTRELTMSEALNEALREEMRRDETVFVIGEDIAKHGGLFKVTEGLLAEFGRSRVIDSPISEAAISGAGVGAALVGARPVVELQISDFITLTIDQVVNHAAKWRYMSGGQVSVPFVIRGPISNGIGMAAQHSQSLESWFVHTPGLIVVMPATPYDAKGLLKAAVREDNPVVFLEKRLLYARKGPVPESEYLIPFGVADVKRVGTDATVVAAGATVPLALQAARQLARSGIELEVIDVRTLKPLDESTIADSIQKTGRLVVVNEGPLTGGYASEVVARMIESVGIASFRATPARVAARDTPIPYASALEREVLPTADDLVAAVTEMMAA